LKYIAIAIILLFSSTSLVADDIPTEARPLSELINAVVNSDVEAIKNLFVPRIKEEFEKMGWDEVMIEYKKAFSKQEFKEIDLTKIKFEFKSKSTGELPQGDVRLKYDGKDLGKMRVLKVGDRWLLNEH
jgi:hypothetical protein